MKWFLDLFSSSLGKKLMMALTGLFLILFITVHLIGNLQLMKSDGGKAFNVYAAFMTSNPLIKTVSYGNYAIILIHALWAGLLTYNNRKARGAQGYAITNKATTLSARNMGVLGSIILIFIVLHMKQFWWVMHNGPINHVEYDGTDYKDLYATVAYAYTSIGVVIFYVVCMAVLGFHLWHGFASAFQTMGLNHKKYNPLISFVGKAYAIIVPALFALIPIWMYLTLPK